MTTIEEIARLEGFIAGKTFLLESPFLPHHLKRSDICVQRSEAMKALNILRVLQMASQYAQIAALGAFEPSEAQRGGLDGNGQEIDY